MFRIKNQIIDTDILIESEKSKKDRNTIYYHELFQK